MPFFNVNTREDLAAAAHPCRLAGIAGINKEQGLAAQPGAPEMRAEEDGLRNRP